MRFRATPEQTVLQDLFDYNEESGRLLYRKNFFKTNLGKPAGTLSQGYWIVRVNNKLYKNCRLVWTYCTGDDPGAMTIDHIDMDRSNDRIKNLRLATRSQNAANRKKKKTNRCGYKGVTYWPERKKYYARIAYEGKHKHLGYFDTAEEAAMAYQAAAEQIHKEFSNV